MYFSLVKHVAIFNLCRLMMKVLYVAVNHAATRAFCKLPIHLLSSSSSAAAGLHASEEQKLSAQEAQQQQQRYRLTEQVAASTADDFLRELNAHQRAMSSASHLSMPSPPLIEPHLNLNSRYEP